MSIKVFCCISTVLVKYVLLHSSTNYCIETFILILETDLFFTILSQKNILYLNYCTVLLEEEWLATSEATNMNCHHGHHFCYLNAAPKFKLKNSILENRHGIIGYNIKHRCDYTIAILLHVLYWFRISAFTFHHCQHVLATSVLISGFVEISTFVALKNINT